MESKIQIISDDYDPDKKFKDIKISRFNNFSSFDSYEFNIINLNNAYLLKYNENNGSFYNSNDFKTIRKSIENMKKKNKIIILSPQNIYFETYNPMINRKNEKFPIKDHLNIITQLLEEYFNTSNIKLIYEKSKTEIKDISLESDFCIDKNVNKIILTKDINKKITTIQHENIIFTTLKINNPQELYNFLNEITLSNEKDSVPNWIKEIEILDDEKQNKIIKENKKTIEKCNNEIQIAENKLNENNFYKSILYKKDKELVKVVFKILEEILDYDLSKFIDEYSEDFLIEKDNIMFIGEIKGSSRNIKRNNLSQLDNHLTDKQDELSENNISKNLKPILIMNTFLNEHPDKRVPVDEQIIKDAENKYGSLIITSVELLKLYELFKENKITTDKIIQRFKEEIGLFKTVKNE